MKNAIPLAITTSLETSSFSYCDILYLRSQLFLSDRGCNEDKFDFFLISSF